MCYTIGYTHEHFVGIKQCLKHNKQLVQTTTILDLYVKCTFLAYCVVQGQQNIVYINLYHNNLISTEMYM